MRNIFRLKRNNERIKYRIIRDIRASFDEKKIRLLETSTSKSFL